MFQSLIQRFVNGIWNTYLAVIQTLSVRWRTLPRPCLDPRFPRDRGEAGVEGKVFESGLSGGPGSRHTSPNIGCPQAPRAGFGGCHYSIRNDLQKNAC